MGYGNHSQSRGSGAKAQAFQQGRHQGQQPVSRQEQPKYFEHIQQGGFLKDGVIREELIYHDARVLGEAIGEEGNTTSQVRRFYNDLKAIEARIQATSFEQQMPFILMMSSKTAAASTGSGKIFSKFKDFIDQSVAQLARGGRKEDFEAFMKIFEAVLGYAMPKLKK